MILTEFWFLPNFLGNVADLESPDRTDDCLPSPDGCDTSVGFTNKLDVMTEDCLHILLVVGRLFIDDCRVSPALLIGLLVGGSLYLRGVGLVNLLTIRHENY